MMKDGKSFYVYILTNFNNKVLYVGVTNNLARRVNEHIIKRSDGFTSRYNVNKLVYFETFESILAAIKREKQVKNYRREKKDILVNSKNPNWDELKAPLY